MVLDNIRESALLHWGDDAPERTDLLVVLLKLAI